MAGLELRKAGTSATYSPIIKRGMVSLPDGKVAVLTIDTNLAASSGTDVTGVAKIYLHLSTDASRTGFTTPVALTPAVAPASSTRFACASMGGGADGSVWVAWQGVDNALYCSRWTYSAGAFTFVSTTTVVASGAVTNRFRAIDIDVSSNANACIATYEANDSAGVGSFHRVYVLMNDGTTWRRTTNLTAVAAGQSIKTYSEDVSIACRGDGTVSNVVRFVLYGTKTSTSVDGGDLLREISFNVSTGTADSGATAGDWSTSFNKNQAAGSRRCLLFTLSNTITLAAGVIGTSVPKFWAAKLTTGSYGAPVVTTAGYVAKVSLSNYFTIDVTNEARRAWTATYKDNRLIFGFASLGSTTAAPRIAREVVFSYAAVGNASAAPTVDSIPRPLDSNYYGDGGPITLYGGDNRRTGSSLKYYNFVVMYGRAGGAVSTGYSRSYRFVAEDTFDAPSLLSPINDQVEPTNRPTFRVSVTNVNLTPNLYGKVQIQIASNAGFSTNLQTITQDDSAYQYFGTKDGLNSTSKQVTIGTPQLNSLFQGNWFWRARIVSDKDTPGYWSDTAQVTVSHPPVSKQIRPAPGETVAPTAGNVNFSWTFSDTEPTDSQTAYWIVIKRTDTDAIVVDTGWVASSLKSVTVAVSASYLEIPLSWTIQVKDANGVAGPVSNPVNWVMGAAPVALITSPVNGGLVTTAAPTVTWSYTGSGGRDQKSYRVQIAESGGRNSIPNTSFEVDLLNWTAQGGSATRSSAQAADQTWSAFVTPDGVTGVSRFEITFASATVIDVEGRSYFVDGFIRPTTTNKPISIGINWYDSVGTYLSSSLTTVAVTAAGTWQYVSFTASAPVGAIRAAARIGLASTPAVTDTFYVDYIRLRTATANIDKVVADSFWLAGTDTSYTFPANVLTESIDYEFRLSVQDEGNLFSYNAVSSRTDWIEPTLPARVITQDSYKVTIQWTNALQDADFVAWRVYRRYMVPAALEIDIDNTANTWVLLYETDDIQTNYTYLDYTCPLNKNVDYVVVQMADRFGSIIESNITAWTTVNINSDRYYFVPEVAVGTIASFQAGDVTGDQFTREVEQETLHVVGRGRQSQIGDDLGYTGSLNIKMRNPSTARLNREFLEAISAFYNRVYIKSPFGDVFLAALGNIQTGRQAGYGKSDIVDLTVPYAQIIEDDKVTRVI